MSSNPVTTSITRHPLVWGVGWSLAFGIALLVAVILDSPALLDWALIAALVLPSTVATVAVLSATPRAHFEAMSSVFSHFFVRYLALVVGVAAWSASVVVGAAISQTIQLAAEGREEEIVGIGFDVMAVIVPAVAAVLWAAFVVRCAWFLARVRGWAEIPLADATPTHLLAGRPALRRVVVGLAHPALFAASGLLVAVAVPFAGGSVDLTI
ncbi:hypothetical protein [Agromyces salentinus]|uniref:hypothetical protein n=1 Tax=Agromyces salentinus TaxID=269421 RepID=UPI0012F9E09E|nr:hypothetical protein [Agromyces salentinus]